MFTFFQWALVVVYGIAGYYYLNVFQQNRSSDRKIAGNWLAAAILVHATLFAYLGFTLGRIPVATLGETLSTLVLMTACIYWVLEKRVADHSMGAFIVPLLIILLIVDNFILQQHEVMAEVLHDVKFEIHVLSLLLAYGAFTLSFIASVLQILLARQLENLNMGVFYRRLPSIAFFEKISNHAVDIGLVFVTIGFFLGLYNARQVWDLNALLSEPKIDATILIWLVYALHFGGRRFAGWRGQRAAVLSIIGYALLLFSMLIISLFFVTVHNFK